MLGENRREYRFIVALVLIVAVLLAFAYFFGGNFMIDDAFISYRYATHIAHGYGVVWNRGGEHTEGFTNLLFVLLLAGCVKVGFDPIISAHVINGMSSVSVAVVIFHLSKLIVPDHEYRLGRMFVALSVATHPLFLQNTLTGLETSFWTALLLLAGIFSLRFSLNNHLSGLIASTLCMFAASLTRPETAALWAFQTTLLLGTTRRWRQVLSIGGLFYVVPGIVFLIWKYFYFGYILPNSFYLKMSGNDSILNGIKYVYGYFSAFGLLPLTVGLVGLAQDKSWDKRSLKRLLHLCPIFLLWVIYGVSNPLMGTFHRFIYPAHVVLLTISISTVVRSTREERILPRLMLIGALGLMVLPQIKAVAKLAIDPRYDPLFAVEEKVGRLLGQLPHHRDIVIAFGDAGQVPYYSEAIVIDTVGLNSNFIARHSKTLGQEAIIDHIFNQKPDLIGFYTNPDHTMFLRGHGPLGDANEEMYRRAIQEGYQHVATFDADWVHVQWLARVESPYFSEISTGLRSIADWTEYDFILANEEEVRQ